jgi:hypothetical protein
VGLQVERAELVDAGHHIRVAVEHVDGAVHQPVQVQDPILLALVVGVAGGLPEPLYPSREHQPPRRRHRACGLLSEVPHEPGIAESLTGDRVS